MRQPLTFTNEVYTSTDFQNQMLHLCQHQNILFERSLASKLSNTPKMIFISHLQPLQNSNKAKFDAFFEKFSHLKLKPVPTQDKFLDFLQNEFSHSTCFQKHFFTSMGDKRFALARVRMFMHPHSSEKKLFGNILSVKFHFVKSEGIYLESGLVSALNG